jgi:hypothetical protein
MKRLLKGGHDSMSALNGVLFDLAVLIVWIALSAHSAACAAVNYNTIALSGAVGTGLGLGPNISTGINYGAFDHPVLNAAGEVAFGGTLTGTAINFTNDYGIWSAAGGSRTLIARSGSDGPGPGLGAGVDFTVFSSDHVLNANGNVAFSSQITGSSSRGGIWSDAGGPLTVVARKGSDGPAGPGLGVGITFSNELPGINVLFNAADAVAFRGTLTGAGVVSGANDLGIWTNAGGSIAVVARTGPGGPGPGLDETISFSDFGNPVLNAAGKIAFFGYLFNAAPGSTTGIWSNAGGSLAVAARSGSSGPGPGLGAGISFASFGNSGTGNPVINAAGELAFRGSLIGAGVSATNKDGIWSTAGGTLAIVARSGSEGPGPGLGPGVNFSSFGNIIAPVINSAGNVAFFGSLTGTGVNSTNNRGVWSNAGGTLAAVARSGSEGPGPGLGTGINFSFFGDPLLNSAGRVAFRGSLTGTGVDSSNDQGIWSNAGGSLQKIIRKGDQFDVNPGIGVDLRTISEFNFAGDLSVSTWAGEGSGRGMFFNDSGRLTFSLTFTDGSTGVFTAQVSVAGDFNGDGAVDAADYVVWRKTDGTPAGYDAWRSHFGATAGAGTSITVASSSQAAIPEPASSVLLMFAAAGVCLRRSRTA